eukprot:m.16150 g.16150  ORF g.16150 m.16150 type:complete len:887 (-) comp10906_c0_seq3:429-3089(-)
MTPHARIVLHALAGLCALPSIFGSAPDRVQGEVSVGENELKVIYNTISGEYSVQVDNQTWISGGATPVTVPGYHLVASCAESTSGIDAFGSYIKATIAWGDSATKDIVVNTSVRVYKEQEMAIFAQVWPSGWTAPKKPPPPAPPARSCTTVYKGFDQRGGTDYAKHGNTTDAECCALCAADPQCEAWVTNFAVKMCFLIKGTITARFQRSDRHCGFMGAVPPASDAALITAFPNFNMTFTASASPLGFLTWGGCQVQDPVFGNWTGRDNSEHFDGKTTGEPLVLHTLSPTGARALVISPLGNYFVGGQMADGMGNLLCGIRNSVATLPKGFTHETIVYAGHGINNTMSGWGDVLLSVSGKPRTDPYDDFVLSHLGYWTDNGAYYYHEHGDFPNAEEALKAVHADLLGRSIPVRYFQWDDWWMESTGDTSGILSWEPQPDIFPSGFTDWLEIPLSMYAPCYSAENVWINDYKWKIDSPTFMHNALPLDPQFYTDLFKNGSKIGQRMFEQDFLCTYNTGTSLTNSDVDSGAIWMAGMDAGAKANGQTLQWCMMNPCHALHSTLVHTMTNGRATSDNCRGSAHNIQSMGQTGLLYYSLGFFASRDNVWTTASDVNQTGCNRYCSEPNAHADNAVAVLGGGPYGPSDAFSLTDRSMVMHACRTDGVLLRARWPLAALDAMFTRPSADGALVWAAHDDFYSASGVYRWSYVMGVNLMSPYTLAPADLYQGQAMPEGTEFVAWRVTLNTSNPDYLQHSPLHRITQGGPPLELPACPPLPNGPSVAHFGVAPTFPNGITLLGDLSKWATMSSHRITDMMVQAGGDVIFTVVAAPKEVVTLSYTTGHEHAASTADAKHVTCDFGTGTPSCGGRSGGDTDCGLTVQCTTSGCVCH